MKHYTGLQYLKIDIANHYGLDREQFETRIDWVNEHEDTLETLQPEAKEPVEYAAAVMAYRDTQAGKPTGYLAGLDACASGPQIMSTLTGCEVGARNTSLIGKVRNDLYTVTTNHMNDLLDTDLPYDRKTIKSVLMPWYYSSQKAPKRVFGEDTEELYAFYQTEAKVAPGASRLLPILLKAWQPFVLEHAWFLPDGFHAKKKVYTTVDSKIEVDEAGCTFVYRYEINKGQEFDRSLPADTIQSVDGYIVREMGRRCNYNEYQLLTAKLFLELRVAEQDTTIPEILPKICKHAADTGIVSLVGVEHMQDLDNFPLCYAEKLLELVDKTLQQPVFDLIMIHDNFKCHPNYMNYVRQNYIDIFVELANSTLLNSILTDITGIPTNIQKLSDNLGELIKDGEYALS